MSSARSIPSPLRFSHNGRQLEVRAAPLATGWSVRVFGDAKPATVISYAVLYDNAGSSATDWNAGLAALMQHARDEITSGRTALSP